MTIQERKEIEDKFGEAIAIAAAELEADIENWYAVDAEDEEASLAASSELAVDSILFLPTLLRYFKTTTP